MARGSVRSSSRRSGGGAILGAAAIPLLLAVLLSARAFAMPAPGDADPIDPAVSGNTGAATYRLPIDAPPGPGGFAPNLTLVYSSRAGDGAFGVGWGLEIPEIHCSGRFGVQNFANCQTHELGNALLVQDPETPGTYHTFVESFQRIRRNGSSWTVDQPTGTKLVFGESASHRIAQDGGTARWLLERMEDPSDSPNKIFFEYDTTTDVGTAYPQSVAYGAGSGPGAGPRRIEFVYESRADARLSFREGLQQTLTRRVREIRVFGHNEIAHRYVFEYAAPSAYTTGRSRLASVQEFGTDCTNLNVDPVGACSGLPKRTFQYRDANDVATSGASSQWSDQPGYRIPFGSYSDFYALAKQTFPQLIGDINGDGLPDRIQLWDAPPSVMGEAGRVLINTGDGFHGRYDTGAFGDTAIAYEQSFNSLQYSKPRLEYQQIPTPLTGYWEGFTGYAMCSAQMTTRGVYLKDELPYPAWRANTSSLAELLASAGSPSAGFFEARPRIQLVDLDNDGLADLVLSSRLSAVKVNFACDGTPLATPITIPSATVTVVFRNTGTGWVNDAEAQQLAQGLPPFEEMVVKSSYQTEAEDPTFYELDLKGFPATSPCANNGYFGFEMVTTSTDDYRTAVCHVPIDLSPRFLDFNGDGYLDLAVLQRDDPDRLWTGDGWWFTGDYGQRVNKAQTRVWIQTPNGPQRWQRAPQYDLPVDMWPESWSVGFAHVGLFHGWDHTAWYFANAGSCDSTDSLFKECGPATFTRDLGVRFADLNGDGLTDVVWKHYDDGTEGVLLNRGGGASTPSSAWCASQAEDAAAVPALGYCPEAARFIPPLPITVHQSGRILGWPTGYFSDLNGDGLLDFVWLHLPTLDPFPSSLTESWIHDPAGASGTGVWKRDARFDFPIEEPGPLTQHPRTREPVYIGDGGPPFYMPAYQVFDVDGNGSGDLVSDHYAFLSRSRHSDLIRSMDNGRGGSVAIEYDSMILQRDPGLEDLALATAPLEPAEASDVTKWRGSSVVSRVTVTGPNLAAPAVTEYAYAHPRFSPSLRSDLGFRLVERTRADQSTVREFYRQRQGVAGHLWRLEAWNGAERIFERREDWEVLAGTMPGSDPTVLVGRLDSVRTATQYPGGGEGAVRQQIFSYDDTHGYNFVSMVLDERATGTLCTTLVPEAVDETNWLVRRVAERTERAGWFTCTGAVLSQSTFTYNKARIQARVDTIQHRDGSGGSTAVQTSFGYDSFGNLTSRTEAVGLPEQRTTEFCYDGDDCWGSPLSGQSSHSVLTGVRDPLGKIRSLTPDAGTGIVVALESDYTDEPPLRRDLDPFGRVEREYATPFGGAEFLRTEFVYHDEVSPPYVERREFIDRTGASGGPFLRRATVLDGFGGVWKTIEPTPSGWVGRFVYRDPVANSVRETYPVACSDDICSGLTGQSGLAKQTTFDTLGRLSQIATPDGTSLFTYGAMARTAPDTGFPMPLDLVRFQSAQGDLTQRLQDGERVVWVDECKGNPPSCEDPAPDRTYYAYDPTGELATIYDAMVGAGQATVNDAAHKLVYHYDTRGRAWRIDDPDAGTSLTSYDGVDNVQSITNARGQVTTLEYDYLDRLTSIDQPAGTGYRDYEISYRATELQRERERVLSQSGALQFSQTFEYDDLGRVRRETHTFPDKTLLLDFAYDELGRPTAITYPDDATVIRYDYGSGPALQRVCEVNSLEVGCGESGAISYVGAVEYDSLGRQVQVTTPAGDRFYGYDAATQRLASDDFTGASTGYTRSLDYVQYDALGNLREVQGTSSTPGVDLSARYTYDGRNRLATWWKPSFGEEGTTLKYFNYDVLGNLTGHAVGSAMELNQAFDTTPASAHPHAVTQRTDLGITYTYDADGNLSSETSTSGGRYYTFDALNRLACVGTTSGGCNVLQVDYDSAGSRVNEVMELAQGSMYPRRYAGELFALNGDRADFHIFAFGEEIAYKRKSPITLRSAANSWWPVVDISLPESLPAALLLLAGLCGFGVLAVRLEWRPRPPEHPILISLSLTLITVLAVPPLPARAGGGGTSVLYRRWILNDALGSASVVLIADPTQPGAPQGEPEREIVYSPFGKIYQQSSGVQGLDTDVFAGHPKEPTTSLTYMRARWQNPTTGSLLSVDPIVPNRFDPQSFNAYAYARMNPLRYVDPSGGFFDPSGDFLREQGLWSSLFSLLDGAFQSPVSVLLDSGLPATGPAEIGSGVPDIGLAGGPGGAAGGPAATPDVGVGTPPSSQVVDPIDRALIDSAQKIYDEIIDSKEKNPEIWERSVSGRGDPIELGKPRKGPDKDHSPGADPLDRTHVHAHPRGKMGFSDEDIAHMKDRPFTTFAVIQPDGSLLGQDPVRSNPLREELYRPRPRMIKPPGTYPWPK